MGNVFKSNVGNSRHNHILRVCEVVMKKEYAILFMLLLSFVGCTEKKEGAHGEEDILLLKVEGEWLECLQWRYGISCNWDKYNKIKESKK